MKCHRALFHSICLVTGAERASVFFCSDITSDGDMVQVCSVSILFPTFSPKICRVPRVEATQLNRRSRGGSTERGECSTSRSPIGSVSSQIPSRDKTGSFPRFDPGGPALEPLQPGEGLLDSWWRVLNHSLWWWSGTPALVISSSL